MPAGSGSAAASRAANADSPWRGGRDQAGERGQQHRVREDGQRQEAGPSLARGRGGVVPAPRGRARASQATTSAWTYDAPVGELVPDGFVTLAGLGLLQRAQLARHVEVVGADGDPIRLAYGGLPASCFAFGDASLDVGAAAVFPAETGQHDGVRELNRPGGLRRG